MSTDLIARAMAAVAKAAAASGAAPGGVTTQVQFNDAGVFAGNAGLTFDKTNKALLVGGATVTTSNPVGNFTQTWNASGVTFTGLFLNITDTASAAASKLADLQVGGTSQFTVGKAGQVRAGDGTTTSPSLSFVNATGVGFRRLSTIGAVFCASGADIFFAAASAIEMRSNGIYSWSSSTDPTAATDLQLGRSAAGILAVNGSSSSVGAAIEITNLGADPSAPAATKARLYTKDVGGKVALMVRFPSGSAVQIAIEP